MKSVYGKLDPRKRNNSFELFGYDFMIDENFKVYLIEVNTNPCLDTPCPLLTRIISNVLHNTFRIAVDPFFIPTDFNSYKKNNSGDPEVKFELIFDDKIEELEGLED
jgi:tubulin--tyrosine ligase